MAGKKPRAKAASNDSNHAVTMGNIGVLALDLW